MTAAAVPERSPRKTITALLLLLMVGSSASLLAARGATPERLGLAVARCVITATERAHRKPAVAPVRARPMHFAARTSVPGAPLHLRRGVLPRPRAPTA